MSATEASRSFAAFLNEVEQGQTVVVTRGGRRIATIGPVTAGSGAEVAAILRSHRPDADFAADVIAARDAVELGGSAWSGD